MREKKTQLNKYDKAKFKNAVLFFASKGGPDVGKKKLAKLLYFTDFTLFELRQKSLTGMPYSKRSYGPMPEPAIFYRALENLERNGTIEIKAPNSYGLERIIPKENLEVDWSVFEKHEVELIKQVAEKYRLQNAGDLEKIAQSEPPYKMVKYGESIPYHLAFYRNSFGEMDLDDDSDTR